MSWRRRTWISACAEPSRVEMIGCPEISKNNFEHHQHTAKNKILKSSNQNNNLPDHGKAELTTATAKQNCSLHCPRVECTRISGITPYERGAHNYHSGERTPMFPGVAQPGLGDCAQRCSAEVPFCNIDHACSPFSRIYEVRYEMRQHSRLVCAEPDLVCRRDSLGCSASTVSKRDIRASPNLADGGT